MSKIKKPLIKSGDFITFFHKPTNGAFAEQYKSVFCWHYKKQLYKSYHNPSGETFIEQPVLWRLEKLKKGTYNVEHPFCPSTKKGAYEHDVHIVTKVEESFVAKALVTCPIVFPIGTKIFNPFWKIPVSFIEEEKEDKFDTEYYNLYAFAKSGRSEKSWREKRVHWCRSSPFLTVSEVETAIDFNLKYEKFLLNLTHTYSAVYSDDDVEITYVFENNAKVNIYDTFNNIWNDLCIDPNLKT